MPPQSEWVSLSSGVLTAEIDPLGAQLSVLRDNAGRDLLWNGDAAVWAGRAPLLFPIVGMLAGGRYRLGSKVFTLPRHGFARGKRFELLESSPRAATFRLGSDESTLSIYPFHFALEVRFAVEGPTLRLTASVRNEGDDDLYASLGFHPGFRWPLPGARSRDGHVIEFPELEPAPIRRLDGDGLLTAVRHPTPVVNRRLTLADQLFKDDAVIFDALRSRFVDYGDESGPRIRLSFPDTPYLGVWSKPNANFICIEPWQGIADPQGYTGDFKAKPGVFAVKPGGANTARIEITIL